MGNELISIIIPIYNVEKYLRQCLDSIMNQSYEQFECLLVNDGSPDNSADICREYVDKDSRFKYFEKENGGVSSARNLGIERSGGAYITFIDPDDWVESDYLEVLYRALVDEKADIAVSTYKQFNVDDNCVYVHSFQRGYDRKVFTNVELIDSLPLLRGYDSTYNFVSCKLITRNILKYIRFNLSTGYGEDMEFWSKVFLISKKIVYENKDTYIYRTSNDHSKYYEAENIRSNVEQRLIFLAMLAARGMDITNHLSEYMRFMNVSKMKLLEEVGETHETVQWLKESLFLLGGDLSN